MIVNKFSSQPRRTCEEGVGVGEPRNGALRGRGEGGAGLAAPGNVVRHEVEGVAGAAGEVGERVAEQVKLQAHLAPLPARALVAQVVAFTDKKQLLHDIEE